MSHEHTPGCIATGYLLLICQECEQVLLELYLPSGRVWLAMMDARARDVVDRLLKVDVRSGAVAGHPIAYKLMPANTQLLLAHPSSTTAQRASFATKR